mgnify:FL=1
MKLEIEITEEEIKSAIKRKVRTAIADQTSNYGVEQYIKESVRSKWKEVVDRMVEEYLSDSEKLKAKVISEVDKKLKAKIQAVMNMATKES